MMFVQHWLSIVVAWQVYNKREEVSHSLLIFCMTIDIYIMKTKFVHVLICILVFYDTPGILRFTGLSA